METLFSGNCMDLNVAYAELKKLLIFTASVPNETNFGETTSVLLVLMWMYCWDVLCLQARLIRCSFEWNSEIAFMNLIMNLWSKFVALFKVRIWFHGALRNQGAGLGWRKSSALVAIVLLVNEVCFVNWR